ncbi:SGNH/GDSL hydrolase family protein, partial [Klebsiella pneumoniae]
AKVNEVSIWENDIYQIERGDKVAGGPGGAANLAASQLANRTLFLRDSLEAISTGMQPYANKEKAMADLVAGKLSEGDRVSVRSDEGGVWIDEYVVANGGLVKTGKSLITQQAITDIIQMIYNDTAGQSHGANLFDSDKAKEGAFINELGGLSDNAAYFASDRIPVLSNEKYVFSINVAHLAFYDINGNMLSRLTGIIAGQPFTTPVNTFSLAFSQTLSTGKGGQMLVKGESAPDSYRSFGAVDAATAKKAAMTGALDADYRLSPLVRNLFDKNRVNEGYALSTNGTLTPNVAYFVTDYIPVMPGAEYILSSGTQVLCFYDQDMAKTSHISISSATAFTVPEGSFYLRFQSTPLAAKDALMLIRGTTLPSAYIGFGTLTTAEVTTLSQGIAWGVLDGNMPVGRNLFNKGATLDDYALSTTGAPYAAAGYFVTPFIPVKPNTQYIASSASGVVVYFDINKTKILNTTIAAGTVFTTPSGAVYVRFQVYGLSAKNTLMMVEGSALPASYLSFGAPTSTYVDTQALSVARSVALSLQKVVVNLYNSELAQLNTAVSYQTGGVSAKSGYFATPKMMVVPGDYFVSNYGSGSGAFYRLDGTFHSGFQNLVANTPFSVPENAYYVRFQVYNLTRVESLMVTPGQAIPAGFIPFGGQTQELPWQGKKRIDLGDSITNTGNFIAPLNTYTGMMALANYGVPGQGVRTMADSLNETTIASADFISILGGTNDYGGNRRLGTIADARADYDDTTVKSFYYDVFYVLDKIYSLKPNVRVMFSTPLKRGAFENQPVYPAANSAGFTLPQYVQAIKEVCSLFSVPVCDLFNESGINLLNIATYTGDNLHPNADGGKLMARRMASVINGL